MSIYHKPISKVFRIFKSSIRFSVHESVRIQLSDRLQNYVINFQKNNPEMWGGLGLGFVIFYDYLNIFTIDTFSWFAIRKDPTVGSM